MVFPKKESEPRVAWPSVMLAVLCGLCALALPLVARAQAALPEPAEAFAGRLTLPGAATPQARSLFATTEPETPPVGELRFQAPGAEEQVFAALTEKNDLIGPNYRAEVSGEDPISGDTVGSSVAPPTIRFFASIDSHDKFAAITVHPDKTDGLAYVHGQFYAVSNNTEDGDAITVKPISRAEVEALALNCGVDVQSLPMSTSESMDGNSTDSGSAAPPVPAALGTPLRVLEMATEFDETYLRSFGGNVANANAAALSIFNLIDTWYRAQLAIRISVVYQHGWSANSPYTRARAATCDPSDTSSANCCAPTDSTCMLYRMQQYWPANQFANNPSDLVHLFTNNISEGSVVGRAMAATVCMVDLGIGVAVTQYQGSSSTTALITGHEVGHNFGADHDDCSAGGSWIMCPSASGSTQFSPYTKSSIFSVINRPSGACLAPEGSAPAPTVASGPVSQLVALGAPVTFSVDASSIIPFGYRWSKNGQPILGAYGPSYSIAAVRTTDVAVYSVEVLNAFGVSYGGAATLAISPDGIPPSITAQPVGVNLSAGSPLTLQVQAAGSPVLRYQWARGANPIIGATAATFSVSAVRESDAGSYVVTVSSPFGEITSQVAVVNVLPNNSSSSASSSSSSSSSYDGTIAGPPRAELVTYSGGTVDDHGTLRQVTSMLGYRHELLDSGDVVLEAQLQGVPVPTIWIGAPNATLIAHSGQFPSVIMKAGDRPAGVSVGAVAEQNPFGVNAAGALCLQSTIRQDGVTAPVKTMTWSYQNGALSLMNDSSNAAIAGLDVHPDVRPNTWLDKQIAQLTGSCRLTADVALTGTQCGEADSAGLFATDAQGRFKMYARAGHAAPGTTLLFDYSLSGQSDPLGNLVITSDLRDTVHTQPVGSGLWTLRPDVETTPRLILRSGQAVPSSVPAATFEHIGRGAVRTQAQYIVFPAGVRTATGASEDRIFMTGAPDAGGPLNSIQVIAQPGNLVSVPGGTRTISLIRGNVWASDDIYPRIILSAFLTGPAGEAAALVESVPNAGVAGGRSLRALLVAGQTIPGTNISVASFSDGTYSATGLSTVVSRFGDVAAIVQVQGAGVSSDNDAALILIKDEMLHLVAQEGTRVSSSQGLYLTEACNGLNYYYTVTNKLHINDRGQVVVEAALRDTSTITAETNCARGLLAVTEAGQLARIALPREAITLTSGGTTAISPASMNLAARGLNNSGQILFDAGTGSSNIALYKTRIPACGADFDQDGNTTIDDLHLFVDAWFARQADFNHDGGTTLQDLFSYLDAWFHRC